MQKLAQFHKASGKTHRNAVIRNLLLFCWKLCFLFPTSWACHIYSANINKCEFQLFNTPQCLPSFLQWLRFRVPFYFVPHIYCKIPTPSRTPLFYFSLFKGKKMWNTKLYIHSISIETIQQTVREWCLHACLSKPEMRLGVGVKHWHETLLHGSVDAPRQNYSLTT